jgi:hypothetical protein
MKAKSQAATQLQFSQQQDDEDEKHNFHLFESVAFVNNTTIGSFLAMPQPYTYAKC